MRFRVLTAFIAGLALMFAASATAQTSVGGGVLGGVNFSTISGDLGTGVTKSNRVGGTIGAFGSVRVHDQVAFEPGLMYSKEGVNATIPGLAGEAKFNVNVIRIPLLFRIGPSAGARAGYFIVGPAVGVVVSAKQEIPGQGTQDVTNELKSASVDIVVGAGVRLSRVFVEGRYSAGLTNINKESGDTNKLRTFSILVGARF